MSDDAMNPDMTPEEEDDAADHRRERLERLGKLPPPTDPGDIRARNREKEELEQRLREYDERKRRGSLAGRATPNQEFGGEVREAL